MNDKFNEMMDKISSGSAEENKKLAENMKNNLSDSQKKAVERLLSDAGLMNKLLANEKVREIIKKFGGDDNGYK